MLWALSIGVSAQMIRLLLLNDDSDLGRAS